jgi:hypothetical protein
VRRFRRHFVLFPGAAHFEGLIEVAAISDLKHRTCEPAPAPDIGAVRDERAVGKSAELIRELVGPLAQLPSHMVFLCEKKVALLLDLSVYTLQRDRSKGRGIPFVVLGSRTVRYRLSDVLAWVEGCCSKASGVVRAQRASAGR